MRALRGAPPERWRPFDSCSSVPSAQRSLGLGVVLTLAFTIGVFVAGPIYADGAREAILSSSLGSERVTVRNARVQVVGGGDFDWRIADASIENALDGVPVETLVPQGLGTVRLGGHRRPLLAARVPRRAPGHLTIDGEAARRRRDRAAGRTRRRPLQVEPGDSIDVVGPTTGSTTLRVTGTSTPPDPDDPFWFGGRSPFPPSDSTEPPPRS